MNYRRLIVNADDYGRTPNVSRGIRQAHLKGIVTSTTAMMNMPNVDDDLRLALEETPRLGLGVHLTLTAGRPVSAWENVPSLVDGEGKFWTLGEFTDRLDGINLDEVRVEWRSQAERFVAQTLRQAQGNAGYLPTHFDSHHHTSYFTPGLFRLMLELAQEYKCAVRYGIPPTGDPDTQGIPPERLAEIQKAAPSLLAEFRTPHPDIFLGSFYAQTATREHLLGLIGNLPAGVSELMCHPGYTDEILQMDSAYNQLRERELAILTDAEIMDAIGRNKIELTSFI